MKKAILMVLVLAVAAGSAIAQDNYTKWFDDEAMRVDLYHTGTKDKSMYSIDDVIIEGSWPGSRTKLIDTTNLGNSLFRVYDKETNTEIYSRGFSTMFGEWQTTNEAMKRARTMEESVRFPKPKKDYILTISERNKKDNSWLEVYRVEIDPNFRNNRREIKYSDCEVIDLHVPENKAAAKTYDILILPEGYAKADHEKMVADAKRVAESYLTFDPYSKMKDIIAIRMVAIYSTSSGIDEPRKGIFKDTAFDCTYNSFDSARYVLTPANKKMRDVAANAPYENIVFMVNSPRYGGGGIFNLYATFAIDDKKASYLILHECGHSFSGLGDEYYNSSTAYNEFYPPGVEPWEPNVTALLDPKNVKWKELLTPGVPVPTPNDPKYKDVIGVFEGAGYVAKGFYRPTLTGMMKDHELNYKAVNREHIKKVFEFYTDK